MLPNLGDAKVDKILSQFSQRYTNSNYIAEKILLPLSVKEKSGNFAQYGTENLRIYSDAVFRAPGTRANSVDYSVSQGSYTCRERALEKRVPDEFVNNSDDPYDPKRDAVSTIMDNIWANQEYALASYMGDHSNITQYTQLSGTDQWSDYTNSDPFDDIETGSETIRSATGQKPNTIAMGHAVFSKLKYHPDIREQLKYTGSANLSNSALIQAMKDLFDVTEVLVGDAVYNSADEGQTASIADIWGKDFWLFYKNPTPTFMKSTLGYTFYDVPRMVDTYREESHKSDVVRVRYSYDQNFMDTSLIYLIEDAVA